MLRKMLVGGIIAVAALIGAAGPARAEIGVDLGIHLGSPPQFMPVPSSPVLYAPSVGVNLFSYDSQFYVFLGNAWYVGPGHQGPWTELRPEFVPRPILAVPVRYYHERPHEWAHWRHDAPPRWASSWGRHWEDRRPEHHAYYRDEHRWERHAAYRDDRRADHHPVYREEHREYRGERAPAYRDERRGERHEGHRDDHRGDRHEGYRDERRGDHRF